MMIIWIAKAKYRSIKMEFQAWIVLVGCVALSVSSRVKREESCKSKTGNTIMNGQYFPDEGNFRYKCVNGNKKIAGCLITNDISLIPVGSSRLKGGYTYNCQQKNGMVSLVPKANGCITGNPPITIGVGGTHISKNTFKYKCVQQGDKMNLQPMGCLIPNDNTLIPVGSSRVKGGYTYSCQQKNGGMSLVPKANGCITGNPPITIGVGGTHINKDKFKYQCVQQGDKMKLQPMACKYDAASGSVWIPCNGNRPAGDYRTAQCTCKEKEMSFQIKDTGPKGCRFDKPTKRVISFGNTFMSGNFKYKCVEKGDGGGKAQPVACKYASPEGELWFYCNNPSQQGKYYGTCTCTGGSMSFKVQEKKT